MTRNEFEQKYLNKMVEVVLYDNDIRENGVRFRKSHIKRIKLVSCLSINKCYKL